MEWTWPFVFLSGIICLSVSLFLLIRSTKKVSVSSENLPPGPPGWPVIGNLLDLLCATPHRSLASLSVKYGPVMWLRLGAVNAMVISSAEAAMEMFNNHDETFSGRTTSEALKSHNFDQSCLSLSQYGPYWRMLRRLYTTELFSNDQINETQGLHTRCVEHMISFARDGAQKYSSIDIGQGVAIVGFNVIGDLTLSKSNLVDPLSESDRGYGFVIWTTECIRWVGKRNLADFLPFLRRLDLQSIKETVTYILQEQFDFASKFIQERILDRQKGGASTKKDFLDMMLDFEGNQRDGEPAKLSEENINILITELFMSATGKTTSTIEWALAELLKNPMTMESLRAELDQIVGAENKVEEGDIEKLAYLQAVVKETLRLHPVVPFLVPRRAMEDSKFMGYTIPKDTQILVNVWAIGTDAGYWDDPLAFKPERFLRSGSSTSSRSSSDYNYKGQHFEFLPFGAGRRICPGLKLAERIVLHAIASLIHSFKWELEDGIPPEKLDMRERLGVTMRKRKPLWVALEPREVVVTENPDIVTDHT